ncbi:MAG: 1-phosphofructokinase family hexose kinase [Acidimicrobiales bacterium]
MILTVTANAALDNTYVVAELVAGATHRVEEVHRQAGGKGINVSRVLTTMGVATLALGLVGGDVGAAIRRDLATSSIVEEMVEASGISRQTVVARARAGEIIEFDEPGMVGHAPDWDLFVGTFSKRVRHASLVVLSGSLPCAVPEDAYADLIVRAHQAGALVVLDTSGSALVKALHAQPDVVKPNHAELSAFVGSPISSVAEVIQASRALLDAGAGSVVASRGAEGAIAVTRDGVWECTHAARRGNGVGAGDALVAGLVAGLAAGLAFSSCARQGVVWALASLASPWAGCIDPGEVAICEDRVVVRALKELDLSEGGRV